MEQLFDNHTHSTFSADSEMSLDTAFSSALGRGVAGISITDHLDLWAPRGSEQYVFDINAQQRAIDEASTAYPALKVFKGVEVGLQPGVVSRIKEWIKGCSFDIVIASVHFIDGLDPYYGNYYEGKEFREAYGRALDVIASTAIEYGDFDVVGHIDYIARYAPYSVRSIRYSDFPEHLDGLLRYMAQNGKAFEVNTNTYRSRGGAVPEFDTAILRRFRELGGECVSFGSDAHTPERIAENFQHFSSVVKECGFSYCVHYEGRRACFTKL